MPTKELPTSNLKLILYLTITNIKANRYIIAAKNKRILMYNKRIPPSHIINMKGENVL